MMNIKFRLILLFFFLLISCKSTTEDPEFLNTISGRYLYNADEELDVFNENGNLFLSWRGAAKIVPLHVGDGVYYIKEMNEKITFQKKPSDDHYYISLVPKDEASEIDFDFIKLNLGQHVPSYYLKNNQFDKAVEGYKALQKKDSLNELIAENRFNRMGYSMLRDKDLTYAIAIFKLNVALHPSSSNVYDSLGEAFMRNGDTLEAVKNYKKALAINSENGRARRIIEKYNN